MNYGIACKIYGQTHFVLTNGNKCIAENEEKMESELILNPNYGFSFGFRIIRWNFSVAKSYNSKHKPKQKQKTKTKTCLKLCVHHEC